MCPSTTADVAPVAASEGTIDAARFWAGLEDGRLEFERCGTCGRAVFPARHLCPWCLGTDLHWEVSGGLGAVYTYTRVPDLDGTWAVFAAVQLDENFAMMSRIVGDRAESVSIGLRVRFRPESLNGRLLPMFTEDERCP